MPGCLADTLMRHDEGFIRMRKKSDSSMSSLDLLLDTICNMFGGILLMAILVVVLTQTSASHISPYVPMDIEETMESRSLRAEILRLENATLDLKTKAAAAQSEYVSAVPSVTRDLLDRRQAFAEAHRNALRRLETASQQREATANNLALLEQEATRVTNALATQKAELDRVRSQLLAQPASLPRNVRLPHRRGKVEGTAIYYLVKGDKAYRVGPIRWTGGAYPTGDCIGTPVVGSSPQVRLRPRDGMGIRITERPVAASLRRSNPRTHYVVMFVYDDDRSFASFQQMKKIISDKGYRYVAGPKTSPGGSVTVVPVEYHESE